MTAMTRRCSQYGSGWGCCPGSDAPGHRVVHDRVEGHADRLELAARVDSHLLQPPHLDSVLLARYVPKDDDLTVYVFDGLETDPDAVPAYGSVSRTHKPRVYEIAKEFGVESKDVMNQLKRMGGFVRSASSTVEPDALRRLWEHFEAKRTESPRREMPPSSRS